MGLTANKDVMQAFGVSKSSLEDSVSCTFMDSTLLVLLEDWLDILLKLHTIK
jgi:hypothetical protein